MTVSLKGRVGPMIHEDTIHYDCHNPECAAANGRAEAARPLPEPQPDRLADAYDRGWTAGRESVRGALPDRPEPSPEDDSSKMEAAVLRLIEWHGCRDSDMGVPVCVACLGT